MADELNKKSSQQQKSPKKPQQQQTNNSSPNQSSTTNHQIKCNQCNKTFSATSNLNAHNAAVHQQQQQSGNNNKNRKRKRKSSKNAKTNNANKINEEIDPFREKLFDALRKSEEGQELNVFINFVKPNFFNLVDVHNQIKADLIYVLSQRFQRFEVVLYGSAVSGLALSGE